MKAKKIAWSDYFNSYIACVTYLEDDTWTFALCRKDGKIGKWRQYTAKKANTRYSAFNWIDSERD